MLNTLILEFILLHFHFLIHLLLLNKSFVEQYITKYIQPFNAPSYQMILSQVISSSHLEKNYNADEEKEIDNDADNIFTKIHID